MLKRAFFCSSIAILFIASVMIGCGTPSNYLQSLSIAPASAVGSAQFVASGVRVNGAKVTPVSARWWNTQPWTMNPTVSPGVTIDDNGNATCISNPPISGTFTVWATAPANPRTLAAQMNSQTVQVAAMAQISCP